ncbi:HAD-IIB family hydrolase [Marinobacter mobilis]|uniref:HAD-IIB family hydrolase n=1 Tax=Marinobacter mobilis TaxID=488533 RepID=UPI0035C6A312
MSKPRLLVFTDLDGTLLDHESYSWQAAEPALACLKAAGIPLVINSSKTAAEIAELRTQLGNDAPYIVENGAAVVIPENYFGAGCERLVSFGANHAEVIKTLMQLRSQGYAFCGFSDMTVDELAELTGLSCQMAVLAKQRSGTEPLLWQDTEERLQAFRGLLESAGLRMIAGGRFHHVMGTFDKADGVRWLSERFQQCCPTSRWVTVALGDGPNDRDMLAAVDCPAIVRGVRSDEIELPAGKPVLRSTQRGPAGWNECVIQLLREHGYQGVL